jgi:hypothetical protein
MARGTTRRGWLILAGCAVAAAAVLTVGLPGSGAGADRGHSTCDVTSHGLHAGWQNGHDPRRPHWTESTCGPTVPATATSDSAAPVAPASGLSRIPASGTVLTLSADQTAPPTQPSPRATTSGSEPQHRVEVAPHAATTANAALVLTGGVFAFTLAVSAIVFAAGRRTGRRVS